MALTKSDLKAIKDIVQGVSDTRTLNKSELKQVQQIIKTEVNARTLSDKDFEKLRELMKITIQEQSETFLATKDDISHLPTKEEFFTQEDEVLKELKTVREEMQILNGLHTTVNDHDDRIEKLEKFTKIKTL